MDKKSCINSAPFQPQPPPTHTAADRMPCGCVSGQIPLGESLRIFPQSMYFHFIKLASALISIMAIFIYNVLNKTMQLMGMNALS